MKTSIDMNTTTITINWQDYEGYKAAMNAVNNSVVNTFNTKSDMFAVEVETIHLRFTPEKLIEVCEHFNCLQKGRTIKERALFRFFVWRYCWAKFGLTTTQIGDVTGHHCSMVSVGMKRVSDYMTDPVKKKIKDEVYEKCDQIFK